MSLPTAPATASLAEKVELGLAHYLRHACKRWGLAYTTTLRGGSAKSFPLLHIGVDDLSNHPDLPPSEGIFDASVTLTLYDSSADDFRRPGTLDDQVEAVECALYDVTNAQTFLNYSTGADIRPIESFHLYDIEPTAFDLATEGLNWLESRSYRLTCAGVDLIPAVVVAATTANYLTLGGNYITLGGNRITLAS